MNIFFLNVVPEPVVEEIECKIDVDCPSLEICYTQGGNRNRCVDPCSTLRPCVANAACKVHSTTPTRTMSCVCFEGYTGNGVVSCDLISKFFKCPLIFKENQTCQLFHEITASPIEIGCSSDDECASTQACRNRGCVNPCAYDDPCGTNAQCTVNDHNAVCKCPPGMTGDPYSQCVPSKILFFSNCLF